MLPSQLKIFGFVPVQQHASEVDFLEEVIEKLRR